MRRTIGTILAATGLVLGLAACGSDSDSGSSGSASADSALKVGVSPAPHGEILKYVADNLAAAEGLKLEIVEFNDYIQPNVALRDKQLDANYFQHVPYLEEEVAAKGYTFTPLQPVHIEPLGAYSKKVKNLAEVPDGGVVAIPSDPSNSGRALNLLATNGLPGQGRTGAGKGENNPYANLLVVRTGDEDDPRVVKLEKLLHSAEVKKFIEDKYAGSVLPAY